MEQEIERWNTPHESVLQETEYQVQLIQLATQMQVFREGSTSINARLTALEAKSL